MNTQKFVNTEELISQLNHALVPNDAVSAIAAISASETTEVRAISALIQAFGHHHPSVGKAAVEALVKLAPASVDPLIIAFRSSADQGVQAYIIQALALIGDSRAFDLLAEVVGTEVANHCQGNVRRIAARGLGKIGSSTDEPEIIHRAIEKLTWALLSPEDWGLRYAAAVSLQEIATPAAYAALQAALNQETDKVVRSRVTTATAKNLPD
ncbi:MAG: HEAT repeat domain-containing protein [Pelatocladus maniniholoensis HA4357-MV3]|jgi:bilin biosynthesis PecF protein|uniref:HEAT repeat domain-containing protein n=1 Tax=Pelatocladus maniniholoensis HA4357-MV3 TaxID=1117104 RepID=A0A9E3HD11_9NOST|nr:HEAT repeat domain-containing protein [Pelatocladus maniniholoensis HA4357-MV3]BAZ70048.1 bilin biosynthesis protein PecF [Fischerella sp. NIES-4106]